MTILSGQFGVPAILAEEPAYTVLLLDPSYSSTVLFSALRTLLPYEEPQVLMGYITALP